MSRYPNLQQKGKKSTEANDLFLGIQVRGDLGPIQPSPAGTTSDNGGRVPIHIGVIFLLYIALKAVLGPERAAAAIKVAVVVVCIATLGLVAQPSAPVSWNVVVWLVGREAFVLWFLHLDERVDDVVLQSIHDEREDHHDECYLESFVALGPGEGPVADFGDPGHENEDDEDADLHAEEAAKVDDGLLEPPPRAGGVAVVSRLDGLERFAERCQGHEAGDDFQENNKNRDTECCLEFIR